MPRQEWVQEKVFVNAGPWARRRAGLGPAPFQVAAGCGPLGWRLFTDYSNMVYGYRYALAVGARADPAQSYARPVCGPETGGLRSRAPLRMDF